MTLTLRRDKGSALTYDEVDDNFLYVANNANLDTVLTLGNTANNSIFITGNLNSSSVVSNTVNANSANVTLINANTVNAGLLFAPDGITLQTVYNRIDARSTWSFGTAGVTGTIITDLNTTITPKLATSKILINFSLTYEVHHDTIFRLFRRVGGVATEIGRNVNDPNYWAGIWVPGYDVDNTSTPRTNTFYYIDVPNTLSPVTYELMIQSSGVAASVFYLNRSIGSAGQASYEVGISQIILQELS